MGWVDFQYTICCHIYVRSFVTGAQRHGYGWSGIHLGIGRIGLTRAAHCGILLSSSSLFQKQCHDGRHILERLVTASSPEEQI